MYPEVAIPVAQIDSVGEPITIHGFRRYEARTRSWGNYPAVVHDDASSVDGLLFRGLSEKQMVQLDWFEDVDVGLYVRERIQIEHDQQNLDVDLYVCGPALERKLLQPLSTAWNPEIFRRNELSRYVKEVVTPAVEDLAKVDRMGI
jgi:gamma-glutamylcyclotransferase (GGCT)/AIG2-like uncharacterized protein YtfP